MHGPFTEQKPTGYLYMESECQDESFRERISDRSVTWTSETKEDMTTVQWSGLQIRELGKLLFDQ